MDRWRGASIGWRGTGGERLLNRELEVVKSVEGALKLILVKVDQLDVRKGLA